jgi:hypothetical protein
LQRLITGVFEHIEDSRTVSGVQALYLFEQTMQVQKPFDMALLPGFTVPQITGKP